MNKLNILLLIIFISLLTLQLFRCNKKRSNKLDSFDPLTKKQDGPLKIHDDKLFADVIIYDNEETRSGIDKCIEKCDGVCVEYGVTGVGQCFPRKSDSSKNYYTTLRNSDQKAYESEEVDRAETKLSYPNFR